MWQTFEAYTSLYCPAADTLQTPVETPATPLVCLHCNTRRSWACSRSTMACGPCALPRAAAVRRRGSSASHSRWPLAERPASVELHGREHIGELGRPNSVEPCMATVRHRRDGGTGCVSMPELVKCSDGKQESGVAVGGGSIWETAEADGRTGAEEEQSQGQRGGLMGSHAFLAPASVSTPIRALPTSCRTGWCQQAAIGC